MAALGFGLLEQGTAATTIIHPHSGLAVAQPAVPARRVSRLRDQHQTRPGARRPAQLAMGPVRQGQTLHPGPN